MTGWINTHGIDMLFAYWAFSAFVSGMPAPQSGSGTVYQWIYHSLHIFSANLGDYLRGKTAVPGGGDGAGK